MIGMSIAKMMNPLRSIFYYIRSFSSFTYYSAHITNFSTSTTTVTDDVQIIASVTDRQLKFGGGKPKRKPIDKGIGGDHH